MPISVRPRVSSGMAGACGRVEGGGDAEGPGSDRRVAGVTLTWAGLGASLFGLSAASGADPHSESRSSVDGGTADFGMLELTADAGGADGGLPRF